MLILGIVVGVPVNSTVVSRLVGGYLWRALFVWGGNRIGGFVVDMGGPGQWVSGQGGATAFGWSIMIYFSQVCVMLVCSL